MESIDLRPVLHRLADRLAGDHARCDFFDDIGELGIDRAFAIDRMAQGIDHAPDEFGAHRYLENATCTLDCIAFGNVLVGAQDDGPHRVAFEVQRQAKGVVWKFEHFALHRVG